MKHFISPVTNKSIPAIINPTSGSLSLDDDEKVNILNTHFCEQSTLDNTNESERFPIPTLDIPPYTINSIQLTQLEVEDVLKSLCIGKACGPDGISSQILRECHKELSKPLCDLFNFSLEKCIMPAIWKEANVCPIFKKGDPKLSTNYRPISLLNLLGKVFERLIFKHVFNFLRETQFFTPFQSGFLPNDSTVNQLTFLYNTFCKALDDGLEVRTVFFDISKAFDKVWHKGLLAKLNHAGISGNLHGWFSNYLSNRRQRVVLPGASSNWSFTNAGVPQGSILGPLLFLIFINDIVVDIGSSICLFADDTSLYIIVNDPTESASKLQSDINAITTWADTWRVTFNPSKTISVLFSRKQPQPIHPQLTMYGDIISEKDFHKHLGLFLSGDGSWHLHINYITEKAWARINVMRKLKLQLNKNALEKIYFAFVRPILEYADVIWNNCSSQEKQELDKIQNEAARIVSGTTKLVSISDLYLILKWESLSERRLKHQLCLFYKMNHNLTPAYLSDLVPPNVESFSSYQLRNSHDSVTLRSRTTLYYNSFLPNAIREWNNLPLPARNSPSLSSFKSWLNRGRAKCLPYLFSGCRKLQVLHTRLRTNCSSLNHHLFQKNIVQSPLCNCGCVESTRHYFFDCINYSHIRPSFLQNMSLLCTVSLDTILNGDPSLNNETNCKIINTVHKYIHDSQRF